MKKSVAVENNAVKTGTYVAPKKSLFKECKKHYALLLMLLPGVLALLLFNYLPMGGLLVAFKEYKFRLGILGSPWADNYGMRYMIEMFAGGDFLRIFKNTVVISFLKMVIGWPLPIAFALMLNEMRGKVYKRIVQTISYLPHFFSWVILGGIFKMVFSTMGPVNQILQMLGASEPVNFMGQNTSFLWIIVGTAAWQSLGWSAIIYMAALSGVDESLYEAAYIDGASRWKQVWHISIPSIMGTITTVFIMNLGGVLNAGFDQIYNMYNVSVYEISDILDTYSLRLLSAGRYEMGTALGMFKSVVGLIFVLGSNWVVKVVSKDEYGIM